MRETLFLIRQWFIQLPLTKIAAITAFAATGAALPKDLSKRDRMLTFVIGVTAALVFGAPVRGLMGLSEVWGWQG